MHGDWFSDNEAIGDELPNGLTGVGVGDFVDLVRVKPDLALTAAGYGRGETFLGAEIDPVSMTGSVNEMYDYFMARQNGRQIEIDCDPIKVEQGRCIVSFTIYSVETANEATYILERQ